MSVPANNLYDLVHQVTEKRFWLVYFYPWGSRGLKNVIDYQADPATLYSTQGLDPKYISAKKIFPESIPFFHHHIEETQPILYCHDQEPLNFDLYKNIDSDDIFQTVLFPQSLMPKDQNLRYARPMNVLKRVVLLHSELNSPELARYEQTGKYLGAYWWSHAIISRDWFRFAETDQRLQYQQEQKRFLVYSREHTGSRAYRKTFREMVQANGMTQHCQFESFTAHEVTSDSSAVYVPDDFNYTSISVVLETVFWDQRIHLTEKILRAIACGHPFILAAGAGALQLLKTYGFKTFSPWIDESYDQEQDHQIRLEMIVKEMTRLQNLPADEFKELIAQCRQIAQNNKHRFFSAEFQNQVLNELRTNTAQAWDQVWNQFDFTYYHTWLNYSDTIPLEKRPIHSEETAEYVRPFIKYIESGGSFEQYQCHEHGLDNKSCANSDDI